MTEQVNEIHWLRNGHFFTPISQWRCCIRDLRLRHYLKISSTKPYLGCLALKPVLAVFTIEARRGLRPNSEEILREVVRSEGFNFPQEWLHLTYHLFLHALL